MIRSVMAIALAAGLSLGLAAQALADGEVVAGDCHLANGVIIEETGRTPVHPIQMIARAYGIAPES
jgi:hypothetical protein